MTLLVAPKHFGFVNPALSARIEGDEIVVTSLAYAKGVMIASDDHDMLLSDNYFDMDAGERRVKVIRGAARALKLRSVYDIADREDEAE
jgi:beta-mannosidase